MLELQGRPYRSCDGLSRRDVLRAGVLGAAGLTLADVLRAQARSAPAKSPSSNQQDRSVILIWLDGGPPQHETYDPKPAAPAEFRGPLNAIDTALPGVQVSELFPRQAQLMDRMALIRSLHHDNGDHFAAAHWMLTGYLGANSVNQTPTHPSAASVIARLKGAKKPNIPPYIGLPNTHSVGIAPGYHGSAYLGDAWNPFNADGDPNTEGYRVPSLTLPNGLDPARLQNRQALQSAFDAARAALDKGALAHQTSSSSGNNDDDPFTAQAFSMLISDDARRAFDLSAEDPRLRDRYGRHTWGQSALLARRLVEAGTRFVTLTYGGWDWHSSLESGMKRVLPVLDAAIATLVEDLETRGLLESTLVLVMGEFGRTPKMNTTGVPGSDPVPGRDHWGNVMSVLLAGGGVRPGTVVGASNPRGESPSDRPIKPEDLTATIFQLMGLDPETTFYDRLNRPLPIVPHGGKAIHELL